MEFLLVEGLKPFSILAGFILLLLLFEIALMLIGLSSNVEFDAPEGESPAGSFPGGGGGFDAGPDLSFDAPDVGLLTPDEIALLDLPPLASTPLPRTKPALWRRLLRLTGLGRAPLLVWLASQAAGLSATGFFLQITLQNVTGAMLPGGLALAVVAVPGILLGGRITALVGRLVPSFESHGISAETYNGRRGHVVIGTAARGEPAQVRWRDMYGTTHSLMAEPLRDADSIGAGTEVLIVKTRERLPRIVSLG